MRTVAVAAAAALALAVGGCTDDEPDDPEPPPASSTPTATSAPTATAAEPFDCSAIAAAQHELNVATDEELSRLAINRDDPRAFTVVLLVASQEAAEYWAAVDAAVTPALTAARRSDLDRVSGYWSGIDPTLDAIEITGPGDTEVQDAVAQLESATTTHPDQQPAAEQRRLQDLLAGTCGTDPAQVPDTLTP